MPSLSAARASNLKTLSNLPSVPTALFVGGTSGIGQGTAEAFARHTNGNAHIILCGRNQAATEKIIATFPQPTVNGAKHEFIPCDATLMRNVKTVTMSLLARLPKLNYLVVSPMIIDFKGRVETDEGIDRKLALAYYARWKFIHDLLPLLHKAREAGEAAQVLTVFAAGQGGIPLDRNNLGLETDKGFLHMRKVLITYTDLAIEGFALRNAGISFTHIFPGVVRTSSVSKSDTMLNFLGPLFNLLTYPISYSIADSGEFTLYSLTSGKGGAYWRGEKGDEYPRPDGCLSEEAERILWEHTEKLTNV